jgi:hypothetical protein
MSLPPADTEGKLGSRSQNMTRTWAAYSLQSGLRKKISSIKELIPYKLIILLIIKVGPWSTINIVRMM